MKVSELIKVLQALPTDEEVKIVMQSDAQEGDVCTIEDVGHANRVGYVIYAEN